MRYSLFNTSKSYSLRKTANAWRKKATTLLVVALQLTSLAAPTLATQRAFAAPVDSTCSNLSATIASAIAGDVITISDSCTITTNTVINKQLTIEGLPGVTISTNGTTKLFTITAAGTTIQNLTFAKTDKTGTHNLIGIQANNVSILNNTFTGQYVLGDPQVSRALEVSTSTGLNVSGNTFTGLRQPAYINDNTTGTIANNYVGGTRGWVVIANTNLTFSGNTWGTNAVDIAFLNGAPNNYTCAVMATIQANNANATLDNQAMAYDCPVAGDSSFVGSPKYIRAGNFTTDIAAQIRVPSASTDIRFTINGQTIYDNGAIINNDPHAVCNESGNFVVNTEHITSNGSNDNDIYAVAGAAAGSQWYRLQKNLSGGEYPITAEFKIGCTWYPVTGSGVVYSVDAPTASYILPVSGASYRPSDNPVRVKVEDQFEQFNRMVVKINSTDYEVTRAACDLRQAGNYLLCDVASASNWTGLASGTYTATTTTYTKANNRVDNLLSVPFVIDATQPGVTNLDLEYPTAAQAAAQVFGSSVNASASATDNLGVESVNFYITAPRVSDGVCTGNGTKLAENRVLSTAADGRWRVALNSAGLDGNYCLTAVARDHAFNNSSLVTVSIVVDNTAPAAPALLSPADDAVVTGEDLTNDWQDVAGAHHYIYQSYNVATNGTCIMSPVRFTTTYTASNTNTRDVADLAFCWRVKAVDAAGNESAWSELWKVTTDNTSPLVQITAPVDGDLLSGNVTISGVVTDKNASQYVITVRNSSDADVEGTNLLASPTVADFLWDTSIVLDGDYTIELKAIDAAGNMALTVIGVTVDNTAPIVEAGQNLNVTTDGDKTDASADDASDITYAWTQVSGPGTLTFSDPTNPNTNVSADQDGTYVARLTATDAAGNQASDEFTYTQTAPVAPAPPAPTDTPVVPTAANNPAVPAVLAANTGNPGFGQNNANDADADGPGDTEVLAATNVNTPTQDTDTQGANTAQAASTTGTPSAGFNWWWLLLIPVVLGSLYYLFGYKREE